MKRRNFLQHSATLAALGGADSLLAADSGLSLPRGKAEHCILLWLGGGPAQVDTFDPKALGDPKARKAGSAYRSIDTAVAGVQVSEHLPELARRMDRATILRTLTHDVIDEHAAAVNFMHTGRPVSGTVVYPSLGAVVSHELGAGQEGVPAYILAGYPSVARGSGFLGAKHSYLYLLDTEKGPAGLTRSPGITLERQARRDGLLGKVRATARETRDEADPVLSYDTLIEESRRLAGGDFAKAFDLKSEPATLRERYGAEFGQRCLLGRRLLQQGVRFVEILDNLNFTNGTGWDTHNDGQVKQHVLIRGLDQALSALMDDLETHGLLDKTLICVAGEFGRPSEFDAGGGRGHQGSVFSVLMAGGGLAHKGAIGRTDDASKLALERPISVPDWHATVYHALGIDYRKELFDGDRPVPITDRGAAIRELFT
ncbi:MAG: DUF1501 domain-containing protein [Verrucomicrobiae bacterium]|nr:DUF1501 domain-containing protein [Verrucomicrobiae bacterium]